MIKVTNMNSPRTGKPVANQFFIMTDEGTYFQSYNSIIAFIPNHNSFWENKIHLDEYYWNYSVTTSKYRNIFLGESKKETQAKIDSGEYILTNLN